MTPLDDSPFPEAEALLRRWRKGDRTSPLFKRPWVVAVSGGGDSVGLLRFLLTMGVKLSVAHLNHGVRGEASRFDAEFVGELCRTLDVPFDLGHWQPSRKSHFEADARSARLDWLGQVAKRRGASAVALGHTLDDQAETVLHRVIRGTGLRGLAGIPWRRPLIDGVELVRPLLGVSRERIRQYLATIGQAYRDDHTNHDLNQTRARLRHTLIPKLEADYNGKVVEALGRLAEFASESNRDLERRLSRIERKVVLSSFGDSIVLVQPLFVRYPLAIRIELIRRLWRRLGWPERSMDSRRWQRLGRLETSQAPLGLVVERTDTTITLRWPSRLNVPSVPESLPLAIPGTAFWGPWRIVTSFEAIDPSDQVIDGGRAEPPFAVRGGVDGDRFEPLGMDGKGMALNDFLRGRGVSKGDRPHVPLVVDRVGIIWVVGHRIGDRVRLSQGSARRIWLRADASGCD